MVKDKGIFYFSSIKYHFLCQRPQQLFESLKRVSEDYEVFYVDIPQLGINSSADKNKNIIRPIPGHLAVLGRAGNYLKPLINLLIKQELKKYDYESNIAIVASPIWEPYISHANFELVCYDYMDSLEIYGWKTRHQKMVDKSDIIFITNNKLKKDLEDSKRILRVSNGVNFHFFAEKAESEVENIINKKPVVGYVGAIYDWIDLKLIFEAAKCLVHVDFVLIGPLTPLNKKKSLKSPDNVHFLGEKNYEVIPSYVKQFDVAIIPFIPGDIAKTTDPIKVYEYFSLGKPVVATSVESLVKYDDGKTLKMAGNLLDFQDAIKFFLKNDNPQWQEKRKKIAMNNSWNKKAKLVLGAIENLYH